MLGHVLFIFQTLFGRDADKLEQANDDERTCILYTFSMHFTGPDKDNLCT